MITIILKEFAIEQMQGRIAKNIIFIRNLFQSKFRKGTNYSCKEL
jgi:hypothetical protein